MPTTRSETAIATRAMIEVVLVVFLAELVVTGLLRMAGLVGAPLNTMLIGAVVLSLVAAPPIYWIVLRPLRREYSRRRRAEERADDMSRLAITDALTRIMNRRGITVALLDAMAQSERYRIPLAIAMADIDHFKDVNDTYGHEAGDRTLTDVAGVLSEQLRMPDKVGRYGGEEFLVIFPHTSLAQARKISERIRAAMVKHRVNLGDQKINVTLSLGVTQFQAGEDLEQLLSRVDRALYEAKQAGRNRVKIADIKAPPRPRSRKRA